MGMKKVLLGVGIAILGGVVTVSYQVSGGKAGLKQALAKLLIKQELVPTVFSGQSSNIEDNAIYVLGGAGDSLRRRFARAAELYKQGLAKKILIKSEDMLMGYSPTLGRNLSHNEWAGGKLAGLGVKEDDIEFVVVEDMLLGTFSEAKTLSTIVSRRGYGSLILVSSDYHTARVWYIFSKRMHSEKVNLYIYPAWEDHSGYGLLHELVKFACYRIFL
jgi:uncharacterized SAM-binding protein YcdF (DUF218 family)